MSAENPTCLSMIICDQVIEDRGTGKRSLIGIFHNINTMRLPATFPSAYVFISLANGKGKVQGRLECVNEKTNEELFNIQGTLDFSGSEDIAEMVFGLENINFKEAGAYDLRFITNDELIMSRKLTVNLVEQKETEKEPTDTDSQKKQ